MARGFLWKLRAMRWKKFLMTQLGFAPAAQATPFALLLDPLLLITTLPSTGAFSLHAS